jgi:hypothetical protein
MKFKELWKQIIDKTVVKNKVLSLSINSNEKTIRFNFDYGRDCKGVTLPFSWFSPTADFNKVSIVDSGHGVAFGEYEVSSLAICAEIK